jgi:DNA topoisomerase-1
MIYFRIKDGMDKDKKPKFKITDKSGKVISDKKVIDYVKSLVIPPAYHDVKIFMEANPKILFEGFDDKNRRQQIYSGAHKKKASKDKFCHLLEFGQVLPNIESDIKKYITETKMTKNKAISLMIKIIMMCGFRVGNLKYQKLYGSHGISNIFKKHITESNDKMLIKFIGKKGVINECVISDKSIIVEMQKLIKNKKQMDKVFTYLLNGEEQIIRAIEINKWLKAYNPSLTTKMFRTWDTNILFIENTRSADDPSKLTLAARKKVVNISMQVISKQINNTASVCKKQYMIGDLIELYLDNPKKYKKYFHGCLKTCTCLTNYLKDFCK